jgi:hypothetical protein
MVHLKLQPFRQLAFGLHQNLKLATKFHGTFKILDKIGSAAYRLQLPSFVEIHPVFHVSQLKKHIGPKAVPQQNLPLVTAEGYIKIDPIAVFDTRALPGMMKWLLNGLFSRRTSQQTKLLGRTSSLLKQCFLNSIVRQSMDGGLLELLVGKNHFKGEGVVRS